MEFWCGISAKELDYLRSFARGVENWTDELQLNQLRCLWTAYCFHQNMEVDTFGYDTELKQLWREIDGAEEIFVSYEGFYNYMAEYSTINNNVGRRKVRWIL